MYSKEQIIEVFKKMKLVEFSDEFFKIIDVVEQPIKQPTYPVILMIKDYNILDLPENKTIEELIDDEVCYDGYYDIFDDIGFTESTEKYTDYFKINDKIYEVIVCCTTCWFGDWSCRGFVPESIFMESFEEIVDFEIISDDINNFTFIKK